MRDRGGTQVVRSLLECPPETSPKTAHVEEVTMKTNQWLTKISFALGSMLVVTAASADEKDSAGSAEGSGSALRAPTHAVELTVGTGYAQGLGDIGAQQPRLRDFGTAGGAVQLGAGYRLTPNLTLGAYGSGGMFGRGDLVDSSASIYTATAGFEAGWHFRPDRQLDPWVSLGSGWRGYWVSADQGTTSLHGIELAKLQVGLDYRLSQGVAISPVIGADLSTFLTESTPQTNAYQNVSNPNVNTFLFGGVQGRFDIPTGSAASQTTASR
jgi:hypothetical protein